MYQGRKAPGDKKCVSYKLLDKNTQLWLQVTSVVLAPGEITFGFSPWVWPAHMLQDVNTILMFASKVVLLVSQTVCSGVKIPVYRRDQEEKPVGDFQASVVKAQDQKSGDQSSCPVQKSYFNT